MRISRKAILAFLVATVGVFILLVVSLNTLIEKNQDRIRDEIQKALGRPLKFDQLQLSFWGGLGLFAKDLRIAEDPRFAATPFIQTKELRMKVRWLPLLWGKVAIKEFALEEPEIQIIKSEAGKFNVATLVASEREATPADGTKKSPTEKEPKRRAAVTLSVSGLRVNQGKIHFIDRAAKEPFELQVQIQEMSLKGSALTGKVDLKLVASLSEGQGQNIRVQGQITPFGNEKEWTKYPLNLQVNIDALFLPQLTRALSLLRESIPPYLGINGPLTIKAKLQGTWERPKIKDLSFNGPLFGATENNTNVSGDLDLSKSGSWRDAEVKGKIALNPVKLDHLKMVPLIQQSLPDSLASDGPLNVAGDFGGSLDDLKVHASIKAEQSEIQYGGWLKKAKGLPALLEVQLRNQKNRLVIEESNLTIQNLKLKFSGSLEDSPERRLTLRLRADETSVSGWDGLLAPLSSYNTRGSLKVDLSVKKAIGIPDGDFDLSGDFTLVNFQAKDKSSGRGVDQLNSKVSFLGKKVRLEHTSFRLGSSGLALEATVPDLSRPVIQYSLSSPRLNLIDFTSLPAYQAAWMKDLRSTGELQNGRGRISLQGNLSSSEGSLQEILYRNLRGDISWSPGSTRFKALSFQALGGNFRADGAWEASAQDSQRMALNAQIEGMDLKALLAQKFPSFKDHLAGKLDLKTRLRTEGKDSSSWQENLRGEGETQVREGILKDINLIERVLSKVSGLPGISNLIPSPLPSRYKSLLQSRDTAFETLAATFTVENERIHTRDLLLATPEYSVRGEGWVGFDKAMKWNASLVMSPQFTQDLVKEHRNARYLLDRQGRLDIPFRLEGTLPQVQAKPDVPGLAELIQRGLLQRGTDRSPGGEKDQKRKERQDWIQKGLEKLFGK